MNAIHSLSISARKLVAEHIRGWLTGSKPRRPRPARTPGLESLEGRRLMAASISLNTFSGAVTIQGTPKADTVVVSYVNNQVNVKVSSGDLASTVQKAFAPSSVKSVVVFGGDGNDRIADITA